VGFGRPALCLTFSTSGTGIRIVAPNCGKLRHLERVFLEPRISLMTRMGGATLPLPAFYEQRQDRAGPQHCHPGELLSKFEISESGSLLQYSAEPGCKSSITDLIYGQ